MLRRIHAISSIGFALHTSFIYGFPAQNLSSVLSHYMASPCKENRMDLLSAEIIESYD